MHRREMAATFCSLPALIKHIFSHLNFIPCFWPSHTLSRCQPSHSLSRKSLPKRRNPAAIPGYHTSPAFGCPPRGVTRSSGLHLPHSKPRGPIPRPSRAKGPVRVRVGRGRLCHAPLCGPSNVPLGHGEQAPVARGGHGAGTRLVGRLAEGCLARAAAPAIVLRLVTGGGGVQAKPLGS